MKSNSTVAAWVTVGVLIAFLACPGSSVAGVVYTVQTGSFMSMDLANEEFDEMVDSLSGGEIKDLRIEKIGEYFSVRMGKFEAYPRAEKFLSMLRPRFPGAILLRAFLRDDRVRRSYPDSISVDTGVVGTSRSQTMSQAAMARTIDSVEEEQTPVPASQDASEGENVMARAQVTEEEVAADSKNEDVQVQNAEKSEDVVAPVQETKEEAAPEQVTRKVDIQAPEANKEVLASLQEREEIAIDRSDEAELGQDSEKSEEVVADVQKVKEEVMPEPMNQEADIQQLKEDPPVQDAEKDEEVNAGVQDMKEEIEPEEAGQEGKLQESAEDENVVAPAQIMKAEATSVQGRPAGNVEDDRIAEEVTKPVETDNQEAGETIEGLAEVQHPAGDKELLARVQVAQKEVMPDEGRGKSYIQNDRERKDTNMKKGVLDSDEKLSLSIQDADIHSVLRALSIQKKLNIVTSQDVAGKISVNVHDLTLREVLDAIITINGFSYIEKDNIIFVTNGTGGSGSDMLGREVRVFKLDYVDVDEMEKVVPSLLSETAKMTFYKPESTLIVEDFPRNLTRVENVLERLDVPPRQVLIETRIMQVRLNDDASLGIDWNDTFSGFFNSSGTVFTQGFTGGTQGFFFNLMNSDFDLFLDALQNITEVTTLSSPSLLALDKKEATIIIGEKLGYYVTTATEATVLQSVEFLDTGTQLILVPHIVDDDRVIMEIHPEVSDGIVIDGLPSKNTAEVTTSLMAPDGGTIFIGGLIRDRKEDIKDRVPGLGAIPVLGALFSRTTNKTSKTEIVVLITPHIITAENTDLLVRSNGKVADAERHLQRKRSLKELLPGMK